MGSEYWCVSYESVYPTEDSEYWESNRETIQTIMRMNTVVSLCVWQFNTEKNSIYIQIVFHFQDNDKCYNILDIK